MAETSIEWTDYTFNPVEGCMKVSPGCTNCYAERKNKWLRHGQNWGPNTRRLGRSDAYWEKPAQWNNEAMALGVRRKVFCASVADVFEDHPDWVAPRERLLDLILGTPWLDWLLLTKRPENILRLWPPEIWPGPYGFKNVWLGTTVEDQQRANERVDALTSVPAVVHFLSVEPLLERVDLGLARNGHIEWVIVGGESGPGARPFDMRWAADLRQQCTDAGVAYFFKQAGAVPMEPEADWRARAGTRLLNARNRKRVPDGFVPLKYTGKGDVLHEMPPELRVREFPTARPA